MLKISQEKDVYSCRSVDPRKVENWTSGDPDAEGPSLDNLEFDWHSGKLSLWNKRAIILIANRLMHESHTNWGHLPKYPFYYYEDLVTQKFSNLSSAWKRYQRKRIGAGYDDFETEEQALERIEKKEEETRRVARQCTRRHTVSSHVTFGRQTLTGCSDTKHASAFALR